jgi:Zn-dependent protease with chaperone function
MYAFLPWLYGRHFNLKDVPVSDAVRTITHTLGLDHVPPVKTSSLIDSPLVYGRRGQTAALVLPDMSLLTEDEQKAVIAHELSHINQGDVGFFTWLTLLTTGFRYWIIPFPVIVYFVHEHRVFPGSTGLYILVPLFFVSIVLLKRSLSRTRESIADAYAVFHGFGVPLKRALFTYAAVKTTKSIFPKLGGYAFAPVLSDHPPLKK